MCRKYFFKNKGCLSRKFIASGLSAVFSAGMFSSYAGAMEEELIKDNNPEINLFSDVEKNKRDFFDFCEEKVEIPQGDDFLRYIGLTQGEIESFNDDADNVNMIPTKEDILPFIEKKFSNILDIGKAKSALIEMKSNEQNFKEIIKQIVYENFKIGNIIESMRSVKEDDNKPEKTTNKSKIILAVKIVVVLIVVGLSVYFYKRGSSKQPETEQPTIPRNPGAIPDDPGTNPDNPGTNPDKPEPDPESDNTEDVQDSLGTKLLKGLGTAAVGGTLAGSGAYAFNEVLRNKESKKVQSKDVNNGEKDGCIYVDSVGNELVEENGIKDNGDDSKKGSRSNEIEEEKLEAEVEDGTESAELEENTKEENESQ